MKVPQSYKRIEITEVCVATPIHQENTKFTKSPWKHSLPSKRIRITRSVKGTSILQEYAKFTESLWRNSLPSKRIEITGVLEGIPILQDDWNNWGLWRHPYASSGSEVHWGERHIVHQVQLFNSILISYSCLLAIWNSTFWVSRPLVCYVLASFRMTWWYITLGNHHVFPRK